MSSAPSGNPNPVNRPKAHLTKVCETIINAMQSVRNPNQVAPVGLAVAINQRHSSGATAADKGTAP